MNMHRFLVLPFVALAALSAGCSSSSSSSDKAPVIDELDGPATATKGASGNYEMTLTITCHDDDGNITKGHIDIPGFASTDVQTPAQSHFDKVPIQVQIDGRAAKGNLSYTVTITDNAGLTASVSKSVTLQ